MEGDIGKYILLGIAIITFLITIGTLIWRMAVLHTRCMAAEKSSERAHNRIDKLEDVHDSKIEKLSTLVQTVQNQQGRMEEKINLLINIERKKEKEGTRL